MKQIIPIPGYMFNVRENTTDEQAILECCKKQVYRKKGKLEIEPTDIWLDLGANVGGFSIHAALSGAQAVYAIEPEPENFNLLQENVRLNNCVDRVRCAQAACVAGDQDALDLYLCRTEKNKYRHTLMPTKGREKISVPCVKFDTIISTGINAIKMDIEGAEFAIFDAQENWYDVRKLAFEYHFDHDRSVANFRRRMAKLAEHFPHVDYNKVPDDLVEYNFYPAMRMVHCYF
jgi:FkbM family methyltransferase